MKSLGCILTICTLLATLSAQTPATPSGLSSRRALNANVEHYDPRLESDLQSLQQAALASDYAFRQVAHLSDNIGPRLSGSPQAQTAVEYVADQLKRLGLEVTLEKVMVPHWVRGEETAALVEYPGQSPNTRQKILLTALGGSVATPADGLTAEIVTVNSFDELHALSKEKVASKIVLFNAKFDKELAADGLAGEAYGQAVVYRALGASEAAKMGAVAALVRSVGNADYRLPHTGATLYSADVTKIPFGGVTAEDADLIVHLAAQGKVRMHLTLTAQTLPDVPSFNVIGDLKGSEHPEQVIIVSGHLDSWDLGTGAIDDAAGVAVAMQTAQLLQQLHLHPKRTIRVIAWMNEENGGAGGKAYAKDYVADVPNHIAAIESDNGAGHPAGYKVNAPPAAIQRLRRLALILQGIGAGVLRPLEDIEADITPLQRLGVPTFGLLQDSRTYFNYHHTAADTLDKVDPRLLQENAAAMAMLAYTIANLPDPLPRTEAHQ